MSNLSDPVGDPNKANSSNSGHPSGLYLLFATEMWERFSFYGCGRFFVLFMSKALLFSKAEASTTYGSYGGLVYLTPLLGGYLSDRFLGNRRSILIGGLLMALGQFFMFVSGSIVTEGAKNPTAVNLMWVALTFLIIGNGFFKPNISTMVGQLYPQGDRRVDGAFTIFYMGINLGALLAPFFCGGVGDTGNIHDFRYGFLLACLGMIVSVITFEVLKNRLLLTPDGKPVGIAAGHYGRKKYGLSGGSGRHDLLSAQLQDPLPHRARCYRLPDLCFYRRHALGHPYRQDPHARGTGSYRRNLHPGTVCHFLLGLLRTSRCLPDPLR